MKTTLEAIKQIATTFFRWWWNKPGENTDDAFDTWAETKEGQKLISEASSVVEEKGVERCDWKTVNVGAYVKHIISKCGHRNWDMPVINDYEYCPYCGKKIERVKG